MNLVEVMASHGFRTQVMIVAYIDESGHSADSRIVAMGGLASTDTWWKDFTPRWMEVLAKHNVKTFHMSDLESSKGEFSGWEKERRESFLVEIFQCFDSCFTMAFGAAVVVEHYNLLPKVFSAGLLDPWFLCFQICLGETGTLLFVMKDGSHVGKTAVFCDRQMEYAGRATDIFHALLPITSYGDRLGSIVFADKKEVVQLQAADLVAYEVKKLVENTLYAPQRRLRWPMQQIQKRPFSCSYVDLIGSPPDLKGNDMTLFRKVNLLVSAGELRLHVDKFNDK